jgi:hypothetical protein
VLFLEWQSKAINDGAQDFQQFSNAVVSFRLVDELEEDITDGSPDESSKIEEFAIDAMQRGLEKVSLSWIFTIEKFEKL